MQKEQNFQMVFFVRKNKFLRFKSTHNFSPRIKKGCTGLYFEPLSSRLFRPPFIHAALCFRAREFNAA